MQIDKKLNLVIPVERDNGSTAYVHVTPIRKEVFEKYFLILSKTFAEMYRQGLGWQFGPRIASMLLQKIAKEDGAWEGPEGVSQGLLGEIVRLSNVLAPKADGGWEMIPLQIAVSQKMLSDEDVDEVKNAATFFTLASWMHSKTERKAILEGAAGLWGASVESSTATEYMNSLPTSITPETTAPKPRPSSIPH